MASSAHRLDDSSSEDEDFIILAGLQVISMALHVREPCRDGMHRGSIMVHELLNGHANRCYEEFRMERHVFQNLCRRMVHRGWLNDTRYVRVDEQIYMFLYIVGKGASNRDVQERFQHSGETISRIFGDVLHAMRKLGNETIRSPSVNEVPPEIYQNPKYFPYFKDCIGAIDGTHIHAIVPRKKQQRYRNRKGICTQNVMCACSFDMRFTFVYTGWEGSANDCRVFEDARRNPRVRFSHPPTGKYYVVDSGYKSQTGYLTPFRGETYHIQEYRARRRTPTTAKELFNYRHSSLRNVIDRIFGVLKNKFKLLRQMHGFSSEDQAKIVVACCGLHNFIRDEHRADAEFIRLSATDELPNTDTLNPQHRDYDPQDDLTPTISQLTEREQAREMTETRLRIANELAREVGLAQLMQI